MEQQSAATQEISRNGCESSTAASDVAALIAEVSQDACQTRGQAIDIQQKSGQVADSVGSLQAALVFLIRTSAKVIAS